MWEELRLHTGAILRVRLFCWGIVFWLGFGQRTPRNFSLGSFWGSGVSSLLLFLPPFLLLLLFWGPARVPFRSFSLLVARTPDFRYLARPELRTHVLFLFCLLFLFLFCLLFLPGSVAVPLLFLPPSALSLSLSLFFLLHACSVLFLEGLRVPSATKLEATTGM